MNSMTFFSLRKHKVYRGDGMDRYAVNDLQALHELEMEIMLHINERLFRDGGITQEMRDKARELILKS